MRNRLGILCAVLIGLAGPASAQMDSDFSAGGAVKIGTSTTTCDATAEGAIRYNSVNKCLDFCDGTGWQALGCGACTTSGLTGLWKMDDGTGSTTAADASGGGHPGTLTNMDPNTDWVAGKVSGALDFDGTNDYLPTDTPLSSFVSASLGTVAMWLQPTGASLAGANPYNGLGAIDSGSTWGIYRTTISGSDRIWIFNYDTNNDSVGLPYTADQWIHVAWVHTGGTLSAYKNGVLAGSTASGNTGDLTNNVFIGKVDSPAVYWRGRIDDVRLYNRALSAAEIAALYNGGTGCQ